MLRRSFIKLLGGLPLMSFPTAPTSIGFRNQPLASFQAGNVVITPKGLFVYDGTPGVGNLIFSSVASGTTTDKFGNKILGFTTVYEGDSTAIQFLGGTQSWYNGSFAAGWTPAGPVVQQNGFGNDTIDVFAANMNLSGLPIVMSSNSNPTHHFPGSQVEIQGDLVMWANAVSIAYHSQIAGDANDRFAIDSNGKHNWGPGNAATDTDLFRSGPGALNTDGQFLAGGVLQSLSGVQILVNPTTNTVFEIATLLAANGRFDIDGNGKMAWGVGGATAVDTDLYREAAGVLASDSILALGNQAAGIPASIAGFSELWSDSFSQLHTDRAFVSEVNFEGKNQAAPPGPGGSGAKLYTTNGYAQNRSAQTGIGGDQLSYDMSQLTLWLTADTATLANTAATNIPGIATKTVQANTYKLRAVITFKCVAAAAGTVTINFAGPATSAGGMSGAAIDNSNTNQVNSVAGLGSIGQTMTNIGRSTKVVLEGVVTFSAAGTLSIQSRTSAAADTYLIQAGSYWELIPVTAT